MKKTKLYLLLTFLVTILSLNSCAPEMQELQLEKYNLTLTVPKLETAPKYTNLKIADYDTKWSRYDFQIGKRVNVIEIAKSIYPENIKMLKEAITSNTGFVSIIEEKTFPNGVFGIIYNQKSNSGKEIKHYNFYFEKNGRYFKMEPVFNNDLKDLDVQLSAFQSLK